MISLERLHKLKEESDEIKKESDAIVTEVTRLNLLMDSKLARMREIIKEMQEA